MGGKLSRTRHCSTGVQHMPKAAYCSGFREKNTELFAAQVQPGVFSSRSQMY